MFRGTNFADATGARDPPVAVGTHDLVALWGVPRELTSLGRHCVRKVEADGTVQVVAGIDGSSGFSGDGGPAVQAHLAQPSASSWRVMCRRNRRSSLRSRRD